MCIDDGGLGVHDDLKFRLGRHRRPHPIGPGQHFFEVLDAKHLQLHANEFGALVQLQVKTHHHAKKARPCATRGPVQVSMLGFIGVHQRAVGQHHVNADDVLAPYP